MGILGKNKYHNCVSWAISFLKVYIFYKLSANVSKL